MSNIIISVPAIWKQLIELPAFEEIEPFPEKHHSALLGTLQSQDQLDNHCISPTPCRDDHRVVKTSVGNLEYLTILESGGDNYYLSVEVYEKIGNKTVTRSRPSMEVSHSIPCDFPVTMLEGEETEVQIQVEEAKTGEPQPESTIHLESPENWEMIATEGTPDSRLLSQVNIYGTNFHVEAIEVDLNGEALTHEGRGILEDFYKIDEEEKFQTVRLIGNRQYVLVIYPFKQ